MRTAVGVAMVLAACLAGDNAEGFALPPVVLASHRAPAALLSALRKGRWTARALSKPNEQLLSKPNTQPGDCCGKDAERSMRLPAQGIDLPDWLDRILTVRPAYKLHARPLAQIVSAGSYASATPRPLCHAQVRRVYGSGPCCMTNTHRPRLRSTRGCAQLRRYCLRWVVFYQRP
jgi:hypothetical protein